MEIPSLAQIKKELSFLTEEELIEVIADLAKFSRDNKAFLFFKLNEKYQPNLFLELAKEDIELAFQQANVRSSYTAKKAAQAIRRKMNKILKLSKNKADQAELIIYFCEMLQKFGYISYRSPVISNLYQVQLGKARRLMSHLHEDLQSDFEFRLENLE